MDLATWLAQRQTETGEVDTEFARGLGISRALWRAIKYHRARPSLRVIAGALRRWPLHRQRILSLALPEEVSV